MADLCQRYVRISIHALLAESDITEMRLALDDIKFLSTLSLRRATTVVGSCRKGVIGFLSTLSLRRATSKPLSRQRPSKNFYPRSPCGERREYWVGGYGTANNFYPRSPCGERRAAMLVLAAPSQFLSTLSLRRATAAPSAAATGRIISIHALLAESDRQAAGHSPDCRLFLSTLSLRRATIFLIFGVFLVCIFLSTLSLRRATIGPLIFSVQPRNFYPRSPCGERLRNSPALLGNTQFLSTLSLRRATKRVQPHC